MLTRRDFVRVSCGAAAGAVLAGLGFSLNPRPAHAIAGVDDALLGAGILGLAGLLGVSLGYKTYTDIESGTADSVGRSFGAYLSDAANEGAIVASAGADAATVVGAGYSEAQLKEAYARGAFADGLAQSITSTSAGALDWLNARTMDAALAWGALKSYFATLDNAFDRTLFGGTYAAVAAPVTAVSSWLNALGAPAEILSAYDPPFVPATVIAYFDTNADYPLYSFRIECFENPLPFYSSSPSGVLNCVFEGRNGGFNWRWNGNSCYSFSHPSSASPGVMAWQSGSATGSSSINIGASNSRFQKVMLAGLGNVSNTVINPSMDKAVDTPQSIDPASWGFGVPVIGTDAVIGNDTLDSTGHLLAPGTLGEIMGDGTLTIPWADIVWGAGLGLGDASVRGIEGDVALPLGVPIPADIPVTVSIPLGDTIYGEKTMTLEDALSSGIDTSISRATDIPVTVEGTPFYPVNPPGTNGKPPSGFPSIPFEGFFPFNMLFSWLHWLNDNVK